MDGHPSFEFASALWLAAAEGDADELRALLADEVVWIVAGDHPLSGRYEGPDAVLDYLASVGERANELKSELTDVYVNDDGAMITYHMVARRELKRVDMDYFLELRIVDGQLVQARTVAFDQEAVNLFWS